VKENEAEKPEPLDIVVTDEEAGESAPTVLSSRSGLSKMRIKDAMAKGAVWLSRDGRRLGRLRGVTQLLRKGDHLQLFYDEEVLAFVPPEPALIADLDGYSVWWKPSGLMTQGSQYGDHASLERLVLKRFGSKREVFIVHRLDREASGLVLVAHTSQMAGKLSELFRKNEIEKEYRADVLGSPGTKATIDAALDDKPAITEYEVLGFDESENVAEVRVFIRTGRKHQIRRHFEKIGHPVMGDPRYGDGNKNREGLRLEAVALRFICPVTGKRVEYLAPNRLDSK
jgi:tRNA pseudouridine32 synthase/23S rRNA pseudouridine746 synthase